MEVEKLPPITLSCFATASMPESLKQIESYWPYCIWTSSNVDDNDDKIIDIWQDFIE